MSDNTIMVFIPMYNCEKQIARVLANFTEDIQKLFCEIVVVDNGSKDRSLELAQEALGQLKYVKTTLLQNCDNYNLGGSHKVAFNYALDKAYSHVAVLHGDDQGSVLDYVEHIKSGEYKNYDQFLGARFHPVSKLVNYPFIRTWGNHALNFLCSLATGSLIMDMGAGLNLYSTEYLKSRFYLYFRNDLTYNVFMLFYGCFVKSKFKFFPLVWKEEDQISNAKVFQQGFRILGLISQYIFARKKIFSLDENEWSKIDYKSDIVFSSNPERESV